MDNGIIKSFITMKVGGVFLGWVLCSSLPFVFMLAINVDDNCLRLDAANLMGLCLIPAFICVNICNRPTGLFFTRTGICTVIGCFLRLQC